VAGRTARKSQWISLVVGPILSIIGFVVTYYVNPLNFSNRTATAAIPAFLLSVIILIIGHNLATFREVERVSADSDRIYEAIKEYLHVTKVGTPKLAWDYVMKRLPILDEVRNTSFNIPEEVERAADRLYESDQYRRAARDITQWTERTLRWKDIGDDSALERLRAIEAQAKAGRNSDHYAFRVIGHVEPQINFIPLNYPDGGHEVLFNWDFRDIAQDPVVLLSRDRDIVNMFSIQFEYLWRAAVIDHDSMATKSTSKK